jgi:hypothetical protein
MSSGFGADKPNVDFPIPGGPAMRILIFFSLVAISFGI